MKRRAAIILLLCSMSAAAHARVVVYSAKSGDTPESIAADYYGNRSLALFITEGNGLAAGVRLRPGQKVRIPTAFHYRVHRGDTLEALAQRFLDDKRRALFLAQLSGLKGVDRVREGQDLLVPFQHVHRAEAPESLASVARAFYGDPGKARLLADFNFRSSPMLAKGDKLLVPIAHVKIRAVRLAPSPPPPRNKPAPPPTLAAAPAQEAQKREAELAQKIAGQLAVVEKQYRDGNYADVPGALDRLLVEDPAESQLAEIFRLKAYAYVALGMDELAVHAFREVIERKPDVALDEATTSPKIRAALDRARQAPAP